jgi:hypothetical protein
MLLGFKGRYALTASIGSLSQPGGAAPQTSGEIHALVRRAREKIDRIRGQISFMPESRVPEVKQVVALDRWSRGLGLAALVLAVITVLAYGGFWFALHSGVSQIS